MAGSVSGETALGRTVTANPFLVALSAIVYSPGLNEGEDEALEEMRANSNSERRRDLNVIRLQLQTGKENIDSYALTAQGEPGVLKAQAWEALDSMYKTNATSNEDWNRVLGNAVVNMSEKIKAINGGTAGTGNVLRTEFVYRRSLYRIDLENMNGVNLVK